MTLDHLDLSVIADGRHSVPTSLRVTVDGKSREVAVPAIADQSAPERDHRCHGRSSRRCTGKNVRVTVDGVRTERTKLFGTGTTRVEPVGIADVHVPGVVGEAPGQRVASTAAVVPISSPSTVVRSRCA